MSAMTRILSFCLWITSAAMSLYGQGGAYGTILGTVIDNSGAVVAKASVDVTNVATNVTKHTETTSSGDFTVPYLTPGTYRVTVQSQGFQKSVVDNIGLVVGQDARADAQAHLWPFLKMPDKVPHSLFWFLMSKINAQGKSDPTLFSQVTAVQRPLLSH